MKDKIEEILLELQREIQLALTCGPLSEALEKIDNAFAKARVKMLELSE